MKAPHLPIALLLALLLATNAHAGAAPAPAAPTNAPPAVTQARPAHAPRQGPKRPPFPSPSKRNLGATHAAQSKPSANTSATPSRLNSSRHADDVIDGETATAFRAALT